MGPRCGEEVHLDEGSSVVCAFDHAVATPLAPYVYACRPW